MALRPLETAAFSTRIPAFDVSNVTVACVWVDGTPTLRPQRLLKPGDANAIVLSLDAPSVLRGTGTSLVVDGHDVAMLCATIVDASLVESSANVSLWVTAGPSHVVATHNGNDQCHEPNKASWHSWLVRAIVQVMEHRVGSLAGRELLFVIDIDVAHTTVPMGGPTPTSIAVTASSPGLKSATIKIPVSTDEGQHGILAAAQHPLQSEQRWA